MPGGSLGRRTAFRSLLYGIPRFRPVDRPNPRRWGASRGHRPLQKQSSEYVGTALLGYLVAWRDRNGPESGCTAFHLAHKVPGLRTQRQERVQEILGLLEVQRLVRSVAADRLTVYLATDQGHQWYRETARRFYSVFGPVYGSESLP